MGQYIPRCSTCNLGNVRHCQCEAPSTRPSILIQDAEKSLCRVLQGLSQRLARIMDMVTAAEGSTLSRQLLADCIRTTQGLMEDIDDLTTYVVLEDHDLYSFGVPDSDRDSSYSDMSDESDEPWARHYPVVQLLHRAA